MEAARSSENLSYHNTTRFQNPENLVLNLHLRENIKCRCQVYNKMAVIRGDLLIFRSRKIEFAGCLQKLCLCRFERVFLFDTGAVLVEAILLFDEKGLRWKV